MLKINLRRAIDPRHAKAIDTTELRNDRERNKVILDRIPLDRWVEPEDIAGAVTYPAYPAARYVTGITLPVDGGWLGR